MGLDQWAYIARKLTADEKSEVERRGRDDLPEGIVCIPEDEADELLVGDGWKDIAMTVVLETGRTDYDAVRKAAGVPDDWHQSGYSLDQSGTFRMWFHDPTGEDKKSFETTVDDLERNWTVREKEKYVAFHRDGEFWYGRKDYDFQDEVDMFVPVVNCGYHILSQECLWHLMDFDDERCDDDWYGQEFRPPMLRRGEAVVYHPWW